MQMSRLMIGTSLLVWSLLFGLAPAAFAASGTHDTDDTERLKETLRLKNVTIPWFLPPPVGLAHPDNGGTCQTIPVAVGFINPVDNHSNRVRKVTREVLADGRQVIVQDDLKTGTAEDSHGATYHFIYTNRAVFNVSLGLPALVSVRMTDNFDLQGHDLDMHVSFDISWDYPAPNGVDITLEPLAFVPTVPFVISTETEKGATNEQLLSIQGDAFNCDPL
jgi:hypothetical protein